MAKEEELIRWVNFYPPCDPCMDPHPWRTTSWFTEADAKHHAKPGLLATVRVVVTPSPPQGEATPFNSGGPHEWGYRDLTDGTFISDDTPFRMAEEAERLREALAAENARLRTALVDAHRAAETPSGHPTYESEAVRIFCAKALNNDLV